MIFVKRVRRIKIEVQLKSIKNELHRYSVVDYTEEDEVWNQKVYNEEK